MRQVLQAVGLYVKEKGSQNMVVLGSSVTCGLGNDAGVGESGLFRMCQFFHFKNKAEMFVAHFTCR